MMLSSHFISRMCKKLLFPPSRRCLATLSDFFSIKLWLNEFPGGSVELRRHPSLDLAYVSWANANRHNSLTGTMMSQLEDILDQLEQESPKAVLFRGSNGSFCAGGDLNFVEKIANSQDGLHMSKYMQWLTNRITCLRSVTAAVLEGPALGGGAELALCCDFRLAAPSLKLGFKQAELGVTTGWGGGSRLVSIVGRENALRLLLTCEVLDATAASQLRLVDHLLTGTSAEEIGQGAEEWLWQIVGRLPLNLVHTIKRVVNYADFRNTQEALDEERRLFGLVWGGADQLEALKNIRQKRGVGQQNTNPTTTKMPGERK